MFTKITRESSSSSASFQARIVPTSTPITPETVTSAPPTTRAAAGSPPPERGAPERSGEARLGEVLVRLRHDVARRFVRRLPYPPGLRLAHPPRRRVAVFEP